MECLLVSFQMLSQNSFHEGLKLSIPGEQSQKQRLNNFLDGWRQAAKIGIHYRLCRMLLQFGTVFFDVKLLHY